jgi:hypothetical protein
MSPEAIESFLAIALGFAIAGLISTSYQLLTRRPASFRLLHLGPTYARIAAIPLLAFATPFLIMRYILCGPRLSQRRIEFVALATIVASFWSMMSGSLVVMGLQGIEQLLA